MLGPPATSITGPELASGCALTKKSETARSRTTHRTLLLLPSDRGLPPATSWMANRNATALPPDPIAHGTGQGSPFLWLQPPWAHAGGSPVVSTVPEQPPGSEVAAELVGLDVAWDCGVL